MKRFILCILLCVCICVFENNSYVFAEANEWNGEIDTTWYTEHEFEQSLYIETAEQLAGLAYLVNNGNSFNGYTINLISDINLGGNNQKWTPIGSETSTDSKKNFSGTFNGCGHKIYNINVDKIGADYVGLFGVIQVGGIVKNLSIEGKINNMLL